MAYSTSSILETLFPADLPGATGIWAVLDGARDDRIFGAVDACYLEKCCLYAGDLPWQLQMTAPYLVKLEPDDDFIRLLLKQGWGRSWGVFLRTPTGMKNLRRHLRELLIVQSEAGKRLLFRYYDPRVLRVYLPTCYPQELRAVFGPIERFYLEDETGESVLEFSFDGAQLEQDRVSVVAPEAPAVAGS